MDGLNVHIQHIRNISRVALGQLLLLNLGKCAVA